MSKTKNIQIVKRKIKQYLDILKSNNIKVIDTYLFGSYAKGNATEDSDIDIAIITNNFLGDEFEFQLLLMKYARDIDIDIEPHPYLEKDFIQDNPTVNEILSTGTKI